MLVLFTYTLSLNLLNYIITAQLRKSCLKCNADHPPLCYYDPL